MAAKDFLRTVNGIASRVFGVQASAGVANAGDIVALGDDGFISATMLNGVGADTVSLPATEALAAGNFVNVYSNGGVFSVRKADASVSGKSAHGFVLAAFGNGASALVYLGAQNTQVSGQAPGDVWLSATTPGGTQAAAPTAAGQIQQRLGIAVSATVIDFQRNSYIQL